MSRVAKKPITLPKGVELTVSGDNISVKGPKGTLTVHHLPGVTVAVDNGVATISLCRRHRRQVRRYGSCAAGQHGHRRFHGLRAQA